MKWVKKLKDAQANGAFDPEKFTVAEAMAILRANDVMIVDLQTDVKVNQLPRINLVFEIGPKSSALNTLYETFIGKSPFGYNPTKKVGWKF